MSETHSTHHLTMTPAQLLDEALSDFALRTPATTAKLNAAFAALRISLPTILRAAAAGNVQCKNAAEELQPHIAILLK